MPIIEIPCQQQIFMPTYVNFVITHKITKKYIANVY